LVLAASSQPGDSNAGERVELVLHAPLESLARNEGNCSFGGHPLHPETARRLGCDARIQMVVHDSGGNPLGIGGASQLVPYWLRREVFRRDANTCTFPGCEANRFLTPHHVHHWARGGPTDLSNLVTVCSFHHSLVHEYGWSVSFDDNGSAVWRRPGGRGHDPGPAPPQDPPPVSAARAPSLAEAAGYDRLFDLVLRL